MKSIIFDVETTGFPEPGKKMECQPYIIEFGAMFIDDDNKVIRTINQLLNPGDRIYDRSLRSKREEKRKLDGTVTVPTKDDCFTDKLPSIIPKITGITDEMLVGKPTFRECMVLFGAFFQGADMLIAHNADFDTKVLQIALDRDGIAGFPIPKEIFCSMHGYQHVAPTPKWLKLVELYKIIMGEELAQTHRALDDCEAVYDILVKDGFFNKLKLSEPVEENDQEEDAGQWYE